MFVDKALSRDLHTGYVEWQASFDEMRHITHFERKILTVWECGRQRDGVAFAGVGSGLDVGLSSVDI